MQKYFIAIIVASYCQCAVADTTLVQKGTRLLSKANGAMETTTLKFYEPQVSGNSSWCGDSCTANCCQACAAVVNRTFNGEEMTVEVNFQDCKQEGTLSWVVAKTREGRFVGLAHDFDPSETRAFTIPKGNFLHLQLRDESFYINGDDDMCETGTRGYGQRKYWAGDCSGGCLGGQSSACDVHLYIQPEEATATTSTTKTATTSTTKNHEDHHHHHAAAATTSIHDSDHHNHHPATTASDDDHHHHDHQHEGVAKKTTTDNDNHHHHHAAVATSTGTTAHDDDHHNHHYHHAGAATATPHDNDNHHHHHAAAATTTTTTTLCDTASCEIYNDPHVLGFDSGREEGPASLGDLQFVRSAGFDGHPVYFGVGDVWLVKTDLLRIQGRYISSTVFRAGGAVMSAIAIGGPILDGKVLLVEPRGGSVTFDGYEMSVGNSETEVSSGLLRVANNDRDYKKDRPFTRADVHLPMHMDVSINRYDEYINVRIMMPMAGVGRIEGQCGNANGLADDDSSASIERRMGGSGVLPEESMFDDDEASHRVRGAF